MNADLRKHLEAATNALDGPHANWEGADGMAMLPPDWLVEAHAELEKALALVAKELLVHVEVRRSIDLRSLLEEAAYLIRESRGTMGAPETYGRVEDDLRAVVAELAARAAEVT